MAEQIIYELEIKGTETELAKLDQLVYNMNELKKLIKEAGDADKDVTEQRKIQLKQEQAEYQKTQKAVHDRNKAEQEGAQTLEKMRAQLRGMNAELEKTPVNTKRFKDLTDQSRKLRDEIKGADEATGRFQANVGNYKGAILSAFQSIGVNVGTITTAMGGLKTATTAAATATGGVTTAMNILKVAVAATGIGLLLIAFASLISYFKSTEEGAARLQKILSPFIILFGNITDVLADMGEALINVFLKPREAVTGLWNLIKVNFIDRLKDAMNLFGAVGKVLAGVFTVSPAKIAEGVEGVKKAYTDMTNGIKETVSKATGAVTGFIRETVNETKKNNDLITAQLELDKRRRVFLVEEAKIEAEISELRLTAQNTSKKTEERQKAINRAIELNNQLASERKTIENETLRIMELNTEFSKTGAEQLNEIAAKKAEIVRLDKQQTDAAREMVGLQTSIAASVGGQASAKSTGGAKTAKVGEPEAKTGTDFSGYEAMIQQLTDYAAFREEWRLGQMTAQEKDIADIQQLMKDGLISEQEYEQELIEIQAEYRSEWNSRNNTEYENDLIATKNLFDQKIISQQEYTDEVTRIEKAQAVASKKIEEEKTRQRIAQIVSILDIVKETAGEETVVGKAAAIAQATANTYLAATEAYVSLSSIPIVGSILAPIAAALAVAAGLYNVSKIAGINIGFARGVIGLNGKGNDTSDSIDARLSRGESVMTAKATRVYAPVLADMERSVGNTPNVQLGGRRFASGFIPRTAFETSSDRLVRQITSSITEIPVVVQESDITSTQYKVRQIQVAGDL